MMAAHQIFRCFILYFLKLFKSAPARLDELELAGAGEFKIYLAPQRNNTSQVESNINNNNHDADPSAG